MQDTLQTQDIGVYLRDAEPASFSTPLVRALAETFEAGCHTQVEKARAIYECVRDRFPHSVDIGENEVSVTAEDVVRSGHGICYAKSHLLAALMRSAGIPAGFCYQLIIMDDETLPYLVVHALNAVYLDDGSGAGRWIRLDARGNKSGIDAQFSLCEERLAFPTRPQFGELLYDTVFSEPSEKAVAALKNSATVKELYYSNLPHEL